MATVGFKGLSLLVFIDIYLSVVEWIPSVSAIGALHCY